MDEKRDMDIEKKRNRGGSADIGTNEDGGIVEMININDHVIMVKEKSIYQLVLADTMDPKRERPDLPPSVHTKLLDQGADDPFVARVFLTAKAVFDPNHYPANIDVRRGLWIMLDVVRELVAMREEIEGYSTEYANACKDFEERNGVPGFMLPSIPDTLTRCKTIFQKADHACQYLMNMIRLFYPEISEKKYYTDFEQFVKEKYGSNDAFSEFLGQVVPFIMEIRNARNCFDHRKAELHLTGFELRDASSVLAPTIEMEFNGSIIPRQDLGTYLSQVMADLVNVIEHMLPLSGEQTYPTVGHRYAPGHASAGREATV
jgi:hypothetical protein